MDGFRFSYFKETKMNKIFSKKLFVAFTLFVGVSALVSCGDEWEAPFVQADNTEYSIPNTESQFVIKLESNRNWKIFSEVPEWLQISQTEGGGTTDLQVVASANNSYARTANLLVVAGTAAETISISQQASTSGRLTVETGNCSVTGFLGNYTITVGFTLGNPHLASEAGVEVNGKKYKCEEALKTSNVVQVAMNTLTVGNVSCRAYARNKLTGEYIYGSTKYVK